MKTMMRMKKNRPWKIGGLYVTLLMMSALEANAQLNCTPLTPTQPVNATSGTFTPAANPLNKPGYQLIFNDEFNTGSFNFSLWSQESLTDGFMQFKTNSQGDLSKPTYVSGVGATDYQGNSVTGLQLQLWNETYGSYNYTGAWAQSLRSTKHGYFEMRAKMASPVASHSSFWLYGFGTPPGVNDWDEIDITEVVRSSPSTIYSAGNYHWRNDYGYANAPGTSFVAGYPNWGTNGTFTTTNGPAGSNFDQTFHTYAVEWGPSSLDYYLDNVLVKSIKNDCNVPETLQKMLLTLSVDSYLGPNPSDFAPVPGKMIIDYVRVYKKIWLQQFGYLPSAGGYDSPEYPRMMADVNGDKKDDIVAFGGSSVFVSLSTGTGFSAPTAWTNNYCINAGGWSVLYHPRMMADVNGDGKADIVGFGGAGVYVSLSNGTSFSTPSLWVNNYGYDAAAGGWRVDHNPRMMADVNGDGKADVVGFGASSVFVSLSTGSGFTAPAAWSSNFCQYSSPAWLVGHDTIFVKDVNNDSKADIVGFGQNGTYVSLSNGINSFGAYSQWSSEYGETSATSWTPHNSIRALADVNNDGKPDVVGFYSNGVHVSINNGSGFNTHQIWNNWYNWCGYDNTAQNWQVYLLPRMTADIDGNGMEDIVGFYNDGVYVSFSNGTSAFENQYDLATPIPWNDFYGSNYSPTSVYGSPSENFLLSHYTIRTTAEVNADCRKDIVAFGDQGVFVTLSPTCPPHTITSTTWNYSYRQSNPKQAATIENESKTLQLIPNPTKGAFAISGPAELQNAAVEIIDAVGKVHRKSRIQHPENETFDISDLAPGIYYVLIMKSNGAIETHKLIRTE